MQRLQRRPRAGIAHRAQRTPSQRFDLRGDGVYRSCRAGGRHHVRACARQPQRNRPTDPRSAANHHSTLACEIENGWMHVSLKPSVNEFHYY